MEDDLQSILSVLCDIRAILQDRHIPAEPKAHPPQPLRNDYWDPLPRNDERYHHDPSKYYWDPSTRRYEEKPR